MTAEQWAESVVALDPTGQRVVLTAPGLDPVALAGHPNPALARAERDAVRAVLAAVLRAAHGPPDAGQWSAADSRSSTG